MIFTTLDQIVRRVLLQKRLPVHYYVEFLAHAAACIRELSYDSLRIVNTVQLTLNPQNAADLPCDYIDWVLVGIRQGQFVQPLTQRDTINNLVNYNAQGQPILYGGTNSVNMDWPFWPGYWMFQNINDLGENVGRLFGYNTGLAPNGFKVIRERGQIQFTESLNDNRITMEYVSDAQNCDNASKLDPMVQATVEAYINWKRSPGADVERSAEAMAYANQRRIYRGRKDELTPWDIRQILYKNYKGSIKN